MSAHLHDIAATIVGLLITLPSAYLAFLAAVSLLPRRARPRVGPSADRETFAILGPAETCTGASSPSSKAIRR